MFSYVYILTSVKDDKLYVGCTYDLRKRIREHNEGTSFSTKGRTPFKLTYYEEYPTRKDAEERERFFKTGWGRQYIKRALKHYFSQPKFCDTKLKLASVKT